MPASETAWKKKEVPAGPVSETAAVILAVLLPACVFVLLFISAAAASAEKNPEKQSRKLENPAPHWWESSRRIYFDIPARILIKIENADREKARLVIDEAWAEFERIGEIFNPFKPGTEVYALNQSDSTEWKEVSAGLYQVLKTSKKLWKESGGLFDPASLQVKKLWQEAEKRQELPSERRIRRALKHTGLGKVLISGGKKHEIRLRDPSVELDFGGIAKGYAVDRVRILLKDKGADSGLLKLGGEICAFGENRGLPWRIGIQHPRQMNKAWDVISCRGEIRVSTSGNYSQPLRIKGHKLYHIFSPKTAKPVSEKVLGVTTASTGGLHSNALLDGAATAITAMGAEKGLELAERLGIEALVLTRENREKIEESMTAGFEALLGRDQQ